MFANSFLQSFLQSCGLANFLQGINRSIIWRLNHGVSKRLQLLEVGVQRSFVPREEFLGRPLQLKIQIVTLHRFLFQIEHIFLIVYFLFHCPLLLIINIRSLISSTSEFSSKSLINASVKTSSADLTYNSISIKFLTFFPE